MSIAMDRVLREVRRIELDGSAAGVAPNIVGVDATYVAWKDSDSDNYSVVLVPGDKLNIQIDGGGGSVLLADVTGVNVRAFDEDNDELVLPLAGAACDDIRRISVDLTCQRSGVTETLRARVFIRSTMSGAQGGS
jgi:hypothetical protein